MEGKDGQCAELLGQAGDELFASIVFVGFSLFSSSSVLVYTLSNFFRSFRRRDC